jgi:L-malate glycosyltransferase
MKILVYAHRLEWGGTQVNAIELSATLRDRYGHDVVILATPGPMSQMAVDKGLRLLPAPDAHVHPSLSRMRALRAAIRQERPDVLHVWDWWQCLDALYAAYLPMRLPMVVSDMTMTVNRFLPKSVPMTFGTPELKDRAGAAGRRCLEVIVPPVDVAFNAPNAVSTDEFRHKYGLTEQTINIVTVSRLVKFMKSESLFRTVDAISTLGKKLPLRLLLVGDGDAREELQARADEVNAALGREAVTLAGPMLDPRPAYAAADIVVGMGGSALRGMAFAKPTLIVGESNFSMPFNPDTAEFFGYHGIYGIGDGAPDNARLTANLEALARQRAMHAELGSFSRDFVVRHFSLESVTQRLNAFLSETAQRRPRVASAMCDGLRTAAVHWGRRLGAGSLRRRLARAVGGS